MLKYLYTADYDDTDDADEHGKSMLNGNEARPVVKLSDTPLGDGDVSTRGDWLRSPSSPSWKKLERLQQKANESDKAVASAPLNNVLVYALAEKYDIETLKTMSRQKFARCSQYYWANDDVLTLLQLVYETTPSTDRGLRDIMLDIYSEHRDDLMRNPRLPGVLEKDAAMAFDIFKRVKEDLDNRISALDEYSKDLKTILQGAETELEVEKAWAETKEKRLTDLIALYSTCRHCSKTLQLEMTLNPPLTSQKPVKLRCTHCNTKY